MSGFKNSRSNRLRMIRDPPNRPGEILMLGWSQSTRIGDSYRSWQRLPGSERIRAVMNLNIELYAVEGTSCGCTKTSKNCYPLSTPDGLGT
jgi:hypothetical protein